MLLIEQKQVAIDELGRKISLERMFSPEIRRLFNAIINDYRVSISARGIPQNADIYVPRWQSLLSSHYSRVQRSFIGEVERQNKNFSFYRMKQDEISRDIIDLALLEFRQDLSQRQAGIITQTNIDQMTSSFVEARQENQNISNAALAVVAARILRRFFYTRIPIISQTETQHVAEATKQMTAEAASGVVPFPVRNQVAQRPVQQLTTKRWQTIGDDRVRPSHVTAGSIGEISLDGIFRLSGGNLRFPGDLALGASIREVINCRCSSVYEVRNA